MTDDEIPSTADDIRALADQAEAEAAEAEALAAAARARARAIQLRRQAQVAEAKKEEVDGEEESPTAARDAADVVDVEEPDTAATESEETRGADEPQSDEAQEVAVQTPAETVAAVDEKPARRWRRLRRPRWSTLAASLAVLVTVAALAASLYMIKEHRDAERQRQRAAEFIAAAKQGVVTLTSLNFNEAKEGVQRILENSTGSFKDDFTKTADDYVKTVEQMKVISQGSVQAAAVDWDTLTADSAVVLVASTQEVTNAAGAKQEPRNYRFVLTVTRDRGQLKISKLEFVP
ncbi:hypothetical protein [Mycobacterium shigaense]|uniref:hypothetical protein n=1 Tax=Mycobacterium shigaense TaxID=722731 RepID=UPI0013C2F3F9|nr:hypothetical protein [Mycobacterium shigaense]